MIKGKVTVELGAVTMEWLDVELPPNCAPDKEVRLEQKAIAALTSVIRKINVKIRHKRGESVTIDEKNRMLMEMAYDRSAETTFAFLLGRVVTELHRTGEGIPDLSLFLEKVGAGVQIQQGMSSHEKARLEMIEKLFVMAVYRFASDERPDEETKH